MATKKDIENARALIRSTQQLRTHWSGIMYSFMGYAIVINVGIWSFFLKAYVDSTNTVSPEPLYLLIATAISSVFLGLWRLYSRYHDKGIADLYPDFLYYENILGLVAERRSTASMLSTDVKNTKLIFSNKNLSSDKKIKIIQTLIDTKHMGRRGHGPIDIFTFLFILGTSIASIWIQKIYNSFTFWICIAGIAIGSFLIIFEWFYYHKEPSRKYINKLISSNS